MLATAASVYKVGAGTPACPLAVMSKKHRAGAARQARMPVPTGSSPPTSGRCRLRRSFTLDEQVGNNVGSNNVGSNNDHFRPSRLAAFSHLSVSRNFPFAGGGNSGGALK